MNILQQTYQTAFGNNRAELDEMGGKPYFCFTYCLDQYFDEAKHKLMKDLVDFNQREDFEMYMRGIEKNYFDSLNFPKAPYDVFPEYPPQPFQTQLKKKFKESQKKDYIDRANEMNLKRQQAYSQQVSLIQPPPAPVNPMLQYMSTVQEPVYGLNQTPFFSSIRNNEINLNTLSAPKYTPLGQPCTAIPTGPSPGLYGGLMEPPKVAPPGQPTYSQRFVAGPSRLEKNPLGEPLRNFKNPSPQKQPNQMNNFDLANPDVQFERYKQLMQNQYYNHHANSNYLNTISARQPSSFLPPPLYGKTDPAPPDPPVEYAYQIYPSGLYNQQIPQPQPPTNVIPGYEAFNVDYYKSLQATNVVDRNLIESLGGIQNTIKPIEDSLKQHELRPFYIQRDYQKELKMTQKGYRPPSSADLKPENLKLVSVSPYRAVVKFEDFKLQQEENDQDQLGNREEEEEEETTEIQPDIYNQISGVIQNKKQPRGAPIRQDSEYLRGQREGYLKNFNEQKEVLQKNFDVSGYPDNSQLPQSKNHQRQYRKMKNQSEYLRNQRENFLNSFSQQRQEFDEQQLQYQNY